MESSGNSGSSVPAGGARRKGPDAESEQLERFLNAEVPVPDKFKHLANPSTNNNGSGDFSYDPGRVIYKRTPQDWEKGGWDYPISTARQDKLEVVVNDVFQNRFYGRSEVGKANYACDHEMMISNCYCFVGCRFNICYKCYAIECSKHCSGVSIEAHMEMLDGVRKLLLEEDREMEEEAQAVASGSKNMPSVPSLRANGTKAMPSKPSSPAKSGPKANRSSTKPKKGIFGPPRKLSFQEEQQLAREEEHKIAKEEEQEMAKEEALKLKREKEQKETGKVERISLQPIGNAPGRSPEVSRGSNNPDKQNSRGRGRGRCELPINQSSSVLPFFTDHTKPAATVKQEVPIPIKNIRHLPTTSSSSILDDNAAIVGNRELKRTIDTTARDYCANYFHSLILKSNRGYGVDCNERMPPGIPLKVNVVAIIDPVCIFIQTKLQADRVNELKIELKKNCTKSLGYTATDFDEGVYVGAQWSNELFRGQIEKIDDIAKVCKVRLVDLGRCELLAWSQLYRLPEKFLKLPRQVVSLTLIDIEATMVKSNWRQKICDYAETLVAGKEVCVELLYALDFLSCHFLGVVRLDTGADLATLILDQGLAKRCDRAKEVTGGAWKCIIRPEFETRPSPLLRKGQQVQANIVQVVNPDEFYIRKKSNNGALEGITSCIQTTSSFGNIGRYSGVFYQGTKMCLAPYPIDSNKFFRARCIQVDYTVTPAMAEVFLIDCGMQFWIELDHLNEYSSKISSIPALAYKCGIDAKPLGEKWSDKAVYYLNRIMERTGKEDPLTFTAIKQDDDRNIVTFMTKCSTKPWTTALVNAGDAVMKTESLPPLEEPPATGEYANFIATSDEVSKSENTNSMSKYCFKNIQPPKPIKDGDRLKTRHSVGCTQYFVMTEDAYATYNDMRQYYKQYIVTGNASKGDYTFVVGDVALARFNAHNYQRAVIEKLEFVNNQACAFVKFFDAGISMMKPITDLMIVDDKIMQTEQLGSVVWLEGVDETCKLSPTLVENSLALVKGWTKVKECKEVGVGKYLARLEIESSDGMYVLLKDELCRESAWKWESLYGVGLNYHREIIDMLQLGSPSDIKLAMVAEKTKSYLGRYRKDPCFVEIRRVTPDDSGEKVNLYVLPYHEIAQQDYKILCEQLRRYYYLISHTKPVPEAISGQHLMAYRHVGDKTKGNVVPSVCDWHRGLYLPEEGGYECIDCFNFIKLSNGWEVKTVLKSDSIDIRELCPEMTFRVPPIGLRLVLNLKHRTLSGKLILDEVLKLGNRVEICKMELMDDNQNLPIINWIPAKVVEVNTRLKELHTLAQEKKKELEMQASQDPAKP